MIFIKKQIVFGTFVYLNEVPLGHIYRKKKSVTFASGHTFTF